MLKNSYENIAKSTKYVAIMIASFTSESVLCKKMHMRASMTNNHKEIDLNNIKDAYNRIRECRVHVGLICILF